MAKPEIVVVGSSNTDMVVLSARLPGPGETVVGRELLLAPGGKGANQAVAAARAGGDVTFVGCMGDDVFGREAVTGLKNEGIDTRYVRIEPDCASGVALIMVDSSGENLISVAPGANARLSPEDVERASDAIRASQCLLVQLEIPLETVSRALEVARDADVPTILNPAPAQRLRRNVLRHVDVLTPNRTELGCVLGEILEIPFSAGINPILPVFQKAARAIREAGVRDVVVTLGPDGALIVSESEEAVRAFKVTAVDTVAAGDVFNGCLAVALTEGKALRDAVTFASAAAAISVTRRGAQPSAPKRDEVEAFLAERTS